MAAVHLDLQQDGGLTLLVLTQGLDPLRGFDVEHSGVVQRGDGRDGRVALVAHVLVGGVRLHVLVDVRIGDRIAPLLPFQCGEREVRIEDGGQIVDERHLSHDGDVLLRSHIRDRAHQQAARRAAQRRNALRVGPALRGQVVRGGDEVGERVLLVQLLAVLVPLPAQLTAAADMRDREDDPTVQQRERGQRQCRVHADLVGPVPVDEGRVRPVGTDVPVGEERDRDLDGGAVVVSVPGVGPEPVGAVCGEVHIVDRGLAPEDGLGRTVVAGPRGLGVRHVVDRGRSEPGGVDDAEERGLVLGADHMRAEEVSREFRARQRGHCRARAAVAHCAQRIQRQQAHRFDRLRPRIHQDLGRGDDDAFELDRLLLGEDCAAQIKRGQVIRAVEHRRKLGDQGVCGGQRDGVIRPVLVVRHQQVPFAVELNGVDRVQQAPVGADEQLRHSAGVLDVEDPRLVVFGVSGDDHQVLLVRGELDAGPELLIVDLQQQPVLLGGGAQGVDVEPVGPPRGIGDHVEGALAGGLQHRAAVDSADVLRVILTALQVAEAQRVQLVPGGVLRIGQQRSGLVGGHPAQLVERVRGGFGVGVEERGLTCQGPPREHLRRCPGRQRARIVAAGPGSRHPAVDRVLLTLDRPGEVPEGTAAAGHGEVGLHCPPFDLAENGLAQRLLVGGERLGIGVLRPQMLQDLVGFLLPQPVVTVDDDVAVMRALHRSLGSLRSLWGRC